MTRIPSARRITSACKTPNKHLVLHLPVSCVGGAQRKPLRWRVEEEPCHTGAQCGAPPTRTGHGRAVPAALEPPAAAEDSHPSTSSPDGSDGQRRSGEAAQLPPPATTVASLPRIQPGAAQASRPSARGPGVQGPHAPGGDGEDHASSPWWRGGTYTDWSRPSEELPPRPSWGFSPASIWCWGYVEGVCC